MHLPPSDLVQIKRRLFPNSSRDAAASHDLLIRMPRFPGGSTTIDCCAIGNGYLHRSAVGSQSGSFAEFRERHWRLVGQSNDRRRLVTDRE